VQRGENPVTGMPFIRWREIRIKPLAEDTRTKEEPRILRPKKEKPRRKPHKSLIEKVKEFLKW
jgi:hypothetical protein